MDIVYELARADYRWTSRFTAVRFTYSLEKAHNVYGILRREHGEARAQDMAREMIRRFDANETIEQFCRPL